MSDETMQFEGAETGQLGGDPNTVDIAPGGNGDSGGASTGKPAVSIADFNKIGTEPANEPAAEPTQAEAEPATVEDEPTQQTQQPARQPARQQPVARDYTGIAVEDKPLFEKMSNASFDRLKVVYKEHGQQKQQIAALQQQLAEHPKSSLPVSYYDNPDGYRLAPEYMQLSRQVNLAEQARRHWAEQRIRVKEGQPWQDATIQDGRLVVNPNPQEPSVRAEQAIDELLDEAKNAHAELTGKFREFVGGFQARHKQDVADIQAVLDKYYPGFLDPKHATAQFQEKVVSVIPASMRSHPLVNVIRVLAAANGQLIEKMKADAAQQQRTATTQAQAASAPPPARNFVKPVAGGKTPIRYSDFAKAQNGL